MARDGTAELVSRDQILRRERGQGKQILLSWPRAALATLKQLIRNLLKILIIHISVDLYGHETGCFRLI